ncbi:alpha-tocopherol transfer protein [Nilaparvata lugens]|uniref:alpha-tocopherol transfer protein n=1 Tax=Nilaparvata lugens TaxID=108931 RepID=UPI00193DEA22|nr:alpha-tocopherol transfer protein [Nilaparvata lugens]
MTEASVKRDVEHLKAWIQKQPHLPPVTDDSLLESFLFNCKNSLEVAKTKLENYYTVRVTIPEFFKDRDPAVDDFLDHIVYTYLPRLTKTQERVVIFTVYGMPASRYKPLETGMASLMLSDLLVRRDTNDGVHIVYDSQGVSVEHTTSIPLQAFKNFIYCYMQAYPMRISGIHVLNATSITIAMLNVAKMFLKEKLRERIKIHSSYQSLVEQIGEEALPKEYGGTYPHSMKEIRGFCHKTLLDNRSWFLKEQSILPDLSKKPGAENQIPQTQLFGLEGSFRKIEID